jgi:hypothetical protein
MAQNSCLLVTEKNSFSQEIEGKIVLAFCDEPGTFMQAKIHLDLTKGHAEKTRTYEIYKFERTKPAHLRSIIFTKICVDTFSLKLTR